jgi:hypothetical protein
LSVSNVTQKPAAAQNVTEDVEAVRVAVLPTTPDDRRRTGRVPAFCKFLVQDVVPATPGMGAPEQTFGKIKKFATSGASKQKVDHTFFYGYFHKLQALAMRTNLF